MVPLSSSSGEFSLLSVVIPALVLLIFIITTVLVLTKIKLRKEIGKLARQHLLGYSCFFWKGFACILREQHVEQTALQLHSAWKP